MELVDMRDLGSRASRRVGSSPTLGTIYDHTYNQNFIENDSQKKVRIVKNLVL